MGRMNKMLRALAGIAVGAAVRQQLRRPSAERTWTGRLLGVPYDVRPPTPAHLRAIFRNPDNPSLVAAHPFGIGWSLNVYRLVQPKATQENEMINQQWKYSLAAVATLGVE